LIEQHIQSFFAFFGEYLAFICFLPKNMYGNCLIWHKFPFVILFRKSSFLTFFASRNCADLASCFCQNCIKLHYRKFSLGSVHIVGDYHAPTCIYFYLTLYMPYNIKENLYIYCKCSLCHFPANLMEYKTNICTIIRNKLYDTNMLKYSGI